MMSLPHYRNFGRILGAFLLILTFACSCSDYTDVDHYTPIYDNFTGVTLYIPNTDITLLVESKSTRTDGLADIDPQEGRINQLYILTINTATKEVKKFPITGSNDKDSYGYSRYRLSMDNGNYKFYILANIDDYANLENINNEDDIRNLILNFTTHNILESGNLPMACLNEDVRVYDSPLGFGNGVDIPTNGNVALYADLSFLCAKVRYTILFNSEEGGISSNFGNNTIDFNLSSAFATNLRKETSLTNRVSTDNPFVKDGDNLAIWKIALGRYDYPENPYPSSFSDQLNAYTGAVENWGNKKAWQGVTYLPENNDEVAHTVLKFPYTFNGSDADQPKELVLFAEDGDGLDRSKFYDVVVKVVNPDAILQEVSYNIQNWNTEKIMYDLHGPYELIVEKTSIELTAGETVEISYQSDVKVTGVSPKLYWNNNGGNIEFIWPSSEEEIPSGFSNSADLYSFDFDSKPGVVIISTNDQVPYNVLRNIPSDKIADLSFFHLKAGNLMKRIDIKHLNIEAYLNVIPQNIIIDVREFITSGIDNDEIAIKINTNLSNTVTFTTDFNNTNELSLVLGPGVSNLNNESFTLTNGIGELKLKMDGFFDGREFWKKAQTFDIKFTVSDGSINKDAIVTISIKPYTTDYVIHFKCKNEIWTNPHIYVYQYLQMPYGLIGSNSEFSGATVGYKGTDGYITPAYEYVFSNNISFRGWLGYGGSVDPNVSVVTKEQGLIIFPENNGFTAGFNPFSGNTEIYDYNTNLNSAHFREKTEDNWFCDECQSIEDINKNYRGWPGIAMIYEGDGWWRYTLSGVATPDKTLILFTNSHEEIDDNLRVRYPKNNKIGIPLFDFPNNEGWLLYDYNLEETYSQNFIADKPISDPQDFPEPGVSSWIPNQPTGIYYRGDPNLWNDLVDERQFYTSTIANVYKTKGNISLKWDYEFKIADINYDPIDLGSSNGNNIYSIEEGYNLINNGNNIKFLLKNYQEYNGILSLKKNEDGSYTLYFKDL